jgi:hypothetical protein
VKGKAYDIGKYFTGDNPCQFCLCTANGRACNAIDCGIPFCEDGLKQITRNDECCPSCRCVVKGMAYDIGGDIPNDNPCKKCKCTEKGRVCNLIYCDIPDCGPHLPITKEGVCCPVCPGT